MLLLLAVAGPALAAEPASEEITVYGDPEVEQAREKLIGEIVGLGYDQVREKHGRDVYVHGDNWRGKVVLFDDGRVATRRTGPAVELPKWWEIPGCVPKPTNCLKAGAWLVSDRRWAGIERGVVTQTTTAQVELGDRVADAFVRRKIELLPDQLAALWERGEPLRPGDPPLVTMEARRTAILTYWRTRTDTVWGRDVQDAVEGFARAVVMTSDHPFTAEEFASMVR
jgi:hypothetical protein